ncbi:Conserved uncharacterized protein [Stigmatella aurantiaca DW4/3-1]|uniref:Conserved uncharacterized protein n=1 Tax=Stigmatella aurantiaca (strain DW4/3-1) TaxID=378806 RepID=E3FXV2_STIAD|nr:Conserved uncharacterized protein [Stigmatella aurantiaca DW4/3-1]
MEHAANKVRIKGPPGPHSREYHETVLKRLTDKLLGCRGVAQCRAALLGKPLQLTGRLRIPLYRPGRPLDIDFTGEGQRPVVNAGPNPSSGRWPLTPSSSSHSQCVPAHH